MVDNDTRSIHILELTVPTNTTEGLINARSRKQSKQDYISLANDITANGYLVIYDDTIEVGSLGHFDNDSLNVLNTVIPSLSKSNLKCQMLSISKVSITCSCQLFLAHKDFAWTSPPLLSFTCNNL